jgi:hypothetical protein
MAPRPSHLPFSDSTTTTMPSSPLESKPSQANADREMRARHELIE